MSKKLMGEQPVKEKVLSKVWVMVMVEEVNNQNRKTNHLVLPVDRHYHLYNMFDRRTHNNMIRYHRKL